MPPQIEVRTLAAQPLAVVRRCAKVADLPIVIPATLDIIWAFVRTGGVQANRNVAVYLDDIMNVEIGVEVASPIAPHGEVQPSSLPAGQAVVAVHYGAYSRLGEAHEAIHAWAKQHGRKPARPCWELYDHMTDDPTKVRTDVFYMLAADE